MKIRCLAVGTKMPAWVYQAVSEYTKRLPKDFSLEFVEIAAGHRGKNASVEKAMEQEAKALAAAIQPQDLVVSLEVKGKALSTEQLAVKAEDWRQSGRKVVILIGGPDGLLPELSNKSELKWSLSNLTLPHPMVRIVLAEQIYRAWTILMNHPYHK